MSRRRTRAEKISRGDTRKVGRRKFSAELAAEVRVESGLPEISPRLKGDAGEIYKFYVRQLVQSELASMPDCFALERTAVALATCWKADRALQREGCVHRIPIFTGRGRKKKQVGYRETRSKWVAIRTEAEKTFRVFANQFGLCGPTSRNSLEVGHASMVEAQAELAAILASPRPYEPDPPMPQ
jgi:hypothetical protein